MLEFEKWAPTVSWATVRVLLCLTLNQGWVTRQVDFSNAFVQATLKEDVYVWLPEGFEPTEGDDDPGSYVLKLNKSLYGLCQSPMYWFFHLKENLETLGLKQSLIDPCLLYGNGMCVLIYVDDCLFFAEDMTKIDTFIDKLKRAGCWNCGYRRLYLKF